MILVLQVKGDCAQKGLISGRISVQFTVIQPNGGLDD
jgi:hypothetical protein